MSSILDLTVNDMIAQMHTSGTNTGKFVARNDSGDVILVIGCAWQGDAEPFAETLDEFLDRGGNLVTQVVGVDEAKANTDALMGA